MPPLLLTGLVETRHSCGLLSGLTPPLHGMPYFVSYCMTYKQTESAEINDRWRIVYHRH